MTPTSHEAARPAVEKIALKILSYMDRHGDVLDYPDGIASIVATAIAQAVAEERERLKKLDPDTLWRDVQGTRRAPTGGRDEA